MRESSQREQYCTNLALKFNLKLGGVNRILSNKSVHLNNKTMVVGIDVTHPSQDSITEAPSVAAVVASIDDEFSQYPFSFRTQATRLEIVQDIKAMIRERLEHWKSAHENSYPENVLVYRDGVSEGAIQTSPKARAGTD